MLFGWDLSEGLTTKQSMIAEWFHSLWTLRPECTWCFHPQINGLLFSKLLRKIAFKERRQKKHQTKISHSMVAMYCGCNFGQECKDYKNSPVSAANNMNCICFEVHSGVEKEDLTATTELWTRWNIASNFSWYFHILRNLNYGKIKACHVWYEVLEKFETDGKVYVECWHFWG